LKIHAFSHLLGSFAADDVLLDEQQDLRELLGRQRDGEGAVDFVSRQVCDNVPQQIVESLARRRAAPPSPPELHRPLKILAQITRLAERHQLLDADRRAVDPSEIRVQDA